MDVLRLVEHLEQQIRQSKGLGLLLLHRDLLIVTLLWHTCSRGINAGSWRLDSSLLPTGIQFSSCDLLEVLRDPGVQDLEKEGRLFEWQKRNKESSTVPHLTGKTCAGGIALPAIFLKRTSG